jgi:hypothetical protein
VQLDVDVTLWFPRCLLLLLLVNEQLYLIGVKMADSESQFSVVLPTSLNSMCVKEKLQYGKLFFEGVPSVV